MIFRGHRYFDRIAAAMSPKFAANESVRMDVEDPRVGKSFEMAMVRARFLRFEGDPKQPVTALILRVSQFELTEALPAADEVAKALLRVLRSAPTVDFKRGEYLNEELLPDLMAAYRAVVLANDEPDTGTCGYGPWGQQVTDMRANPT